MPSSEVSHRFFLAWCRNVFLQRQDKNAKLLIDFGAPRTSDDIKKKEREN